MHATFDLVPPDSWTSNQLCAISFAQENIAVLKEKAWKNFVGNVYLFDFSKVEIAILDVGDPEPQSTG